jgi:hypothetical protein
MLFINALGGFGNEPVPSGFAKNILPRLSNSVVYERTNDCGRRKGFEGCLGIDKRAREPDPTASGRLSPGVNLKLFVTD